MTTLETITTNTITGLLDEVAQSLGTVPGRTPQDKTIAEAVLASVQSRIQGSSGAVGIKLARIRGADPVEAEAVALALHGLALRLGAWLGRER